ncbi:MAG: hypothetical protein KJO10_01775, partial [Gammaproteobacteria bacterium]|nr:hypothetical protein [Gammaproteobacteria bacterium]
MDAGGSNRPFNLARFQLREYNYVLRLSAGDLALLKRYREDLVAGTASFAEIFYNYLFDNPDIADVLYAHERDGGDVGQFARKELGNLLAGIVSDT